MKLSYYVYKKLLCNSFKSILLLKLHVGSLEVSSLSSLLLESEIFVISLDETLTWSLTTSK